MKQLVLIFIVTTFLISCEKPESMSASDPEGYALSLQPEVFTVYMEGVEAYVLLMKDDQQQDNVIIQNGDTFSIPVDFKGFVKVKAFGAPYHIFLESNKGTSKSLSGTCAGDKGIIQL